MIQYGVICRLSIAATQDWAPAPRTIQNATTILYLYLYLYFHLYLYFASLSLWFMVSIFKLSENRNCKVIFSWCSPSSVLLGTMCGFCSATIIGWGLNDQDDFGVETNLSFFQQSPIISISDTTGPLKEVYFPSVTVCNLNQVRWIFNFKKCKHL